MTENQENQITDKPHKSTVRKITMSDDVRKKSLLMLSHYYPDVVLEKKPDELFSMLLEDAIEYMYQNKFVPEFKTDNSHHLNISIKSEAQTTDPE